MISGIYAKLGRNDAVDAGLLAASWVTGFTKYFQWKDIENGGEGVFDWTVPDAFVDQVNASGKKAIVGFATADDSAPNDTGVAPDWLLSLMQTNGTLLWISGATPKIPVYWNAVYQAKWANTITAICTHYNDPTKIGAIVVSGYSAPFEPNICGSQTSALSAQLTAAGFNGSFNDPLSKAQGGVWATSVLAITDLWLARTLVPLLGIIHFPGKAQETEMDNYFVSHGIGLGNNGAGVEGSVRNAYFRPLADNGLSVGWTGQAGKSLLVGSEISIQEPDTKEIRTSDMFQSLIGSDASNAVVITSSGNVSIYPASHITYIQLNQNTWNTAAPQISGMDAHVWVSSNLFDFSSVPVNVTTLSIEEAEVTFLFERFKNNSSYRDDYGYGRPTIRQLPWCFIRFGGDGEERKYIQTLSPESIISGLYNTNLRDLKYSETNASLGFVYARAFMDFSSFVPFPQENGLSGIHFYGGI